MPVPGLVAVAGGKYTTYRVMARDAVDVAVRGLDSAVPPSCTDVTELVGAEGFHALFNGRERLAASSGLHPARIEHLLGRCGSRTYDLLAAVAQRPDLGEPLEGADHYASRPATQLRTRAPSISKTCSRGARGFRSRGGIADWPAPSRPLG